MKRFTDTKKWQPWFRKLTPSQRLLWIYICDHCDYCGAWERDDVMARLDVDINIDLDVALAAINKEKERIKVIRSGKFWFLTDFIQFQYARLRKDNKTHAPAYRDLIKNGLDPALYEKDEFIVYTETIQGTMDSPKDKDKDKDKNKNKEKDKEKVLEGIVKGRFRKPSFQEVTAYFTGKGFPAEAQKFWNHYETVGWVVGRACKPMKSWHGAVATWLGNLQEWAKPATSISSKQQARREKLMQELGEIEYEN